MKIKHRLATVLGLGALCFAPIIAGSYFIDNSLRHNQTALVRCSDSIEISDDETTEADSDLQKLLKDNGANWGYTSLFTIELTTDTKLDAQIERRHELENTVLDELLRNRYRYDIPPIANVKVSYSYPKTFDVDLDEWYLDIVLNQSHFYTSDSKVVENVFNIKRTVHLIPRNTRTTRPLEATLSTLDLNKFSGIFGTASDGDINGNLWFYERGLKLLVLDNIHSFYLNPPKTLTEANIEINSIGADPSNNIDTCLKVSINKVLIDDVEHEGILHSSVQCIFKRRAFAYSEVFAHDGIYSFNLGDGSHYKWGEEKIIAHLSNPLNLVSKTRDLLTTVPLTATMLSAKIDHIEDNDIYYLVKYDRRFANSSDGTSIVIEPYSQEVLVKITGYTTDEGVLPASRDIQGVEIFFDSENREYDANSKIYVMCNIPNPEVTDETYRWFYWKDGRYVEVASTFYNQYMFDPGSIKNGSWIKVQIIYKDEVYEFESEPITIRENIHAEPYNLVQIAPPADEFKKPTTDTSSDFPIWAYVVIGLCISSIIIAIIATIIIKWHK